MADIIEIGLAIAIMAIVGLAVALARSRGSGAAAWRAKYEEFVAERTEMINGIRSGMEDRFRAEREGIMTRHQEAMDGLTERLEREREGIIAGNRASMEALDARHQRMIEEMEAKFTEERENVMLKARAAIDAQISKHQKAMEEAGERARGEREDVREEGRRLMDAQTAKHQGAREELEERIRTKYAKSYRLGGNKIRGDMNQILGTFELLSRYDHVALIVTTSNASSIDALGVRPDSVDFIEIKAGRSQLTGPEREIKKLVDAGKVRYVVLEGNLPKGFELTERAMKKTAPAAPEAEAFAEFQESLAKERI